nr:FAD-dependent oxidoreductase [Sphingomonas sp. CDS-1]
METDESERDLHARQRRQLLQAIGGSVIAAGVGLSARASAQKSSTASQDILDVAILGAGLAGLTAARDLQRAGCEAFVVLEARDRIGGRTYNHELGNGIVSEAGGQWVGPGQTAITDLARELDVATFPTFYQGKSVFLAGDAMVAEESADGGGGSNPALTQKLNALARDVPSSAPWTARNAVELDKLSLGDWLAKEGVSAEDKIAYDTFATLSFGTTPAALGLLQYLAGVNSAGCRAEVLEAVKGGAQETRFVGGSQILCVKMAEALGDKVHLSSPVRKIVGWDGEIVEVHTDQGVFRARRVIVAMHPGLCNQIAFDPPLPEGRAEFQRHWPTHAPMRKTVHVYKRPFWRDAGFNGQVIQIDGPLNWAFDNSPPDASMGIISAFIRPAALSHDSKQAERTLSEIYAKVFGEEALHPVQFHDMDWGKVDLWSLTCIAPIPPGFWTKWGRYLNPSVGRLIWSGTETADIWAGSMDGAVRSGHRAALQALGALAQG